MGAFEQLILFAVVQLGDDACGVEIREVINDRTGRTVSLGAIYTALGRLEKRGWVRSSVKVSARGRMGRPRKQYEVLPAGARRLLAAYSAMQNMAGTAIPKLTELAAG